MVEFKECPVVDNHAHTLVPKTQTLEPIWLAREFFHGMADTSAPGVAATKLWGASEDLQLHLRHMGVVLTAVCQMASLFKCEPTLEAVTAERNRRTATRGSAATPRSFTRMRASSPRSWIPGFPSTIPSSI